MNLLPDGYDLFERLMFPQNVEYSEALAVVTIHSYHAKKSINEQLWFSVILAGLGTKRNIYIYIK